MINNQIFVSETTKLNSGNREIYFRKNKAFKFQILNSLRNKGFKSNLTTVEFDKLSTVKRDRWKKETERHEKQRKTHREIYM